MRLTKADAPGGRLLYTLVVIVAMASFIAVGATASAAQAPTRLPAYFTARIVVSSGPTISNVSYNDTTWRGTVHPYSKKAVPVYFYNRGPEQHLVMGAPDIRAVRTATSAARVTAGELAISVPTPSTAKRVVLYRHQRAGALFFCGAAISKGSRGCHLASATGLPAQSYAAPIAGVGTFLARRITKVCLPVPGGVGTTFLNSAVVWAAAPPHGSGGTHVLYVLLWVLLSIGIIRALLAPARYLAGRKAQSRERPDVGPETGDPKIAGTASAPTVPRESDAD